MQAAAPEVMDISRESDEVLALCGAKPGFVPDFGRGRRPTRRLQGDRRLARQQLPPARRLVEAGVRFVQIYDWGWDHHGVSPGEHIPTILPIKVQQIDRADGPRARPEAARAPWTRP